MSDAAKEFGMFLDRISLKFDSMGSVEKDLNVKKLVRILFYCWVLCNTLMLLPFHRHFWSNEAFMDRRVFDAGAWYDWIFRIFSHPDISEFYIVLPVLLVVVSAVGILGKYLKTCSIIIWVLVVNLGNRAGVIQDGGNNISELIIFYLMFVNASGAALPMNQSPLLRRVAVTASNCAMMMIKMQLVLLYLSVSAFKLNGDLWQSGMSLYYILQAEHYSHPLLLQLVTSFPVVSIVGTYITLVFQWCFPFLVWFKQTKIPLIGIGVCLHLGIAFGMGLLMFGIVMCLSYSSFIDDSHAKALLNPISSLQNFRKYLFLGTQQAEMVRAA